MTPITTLYESSLAGAESATFFAPAFKYGWIFSVVKNTPVDSQTYSTPCSANGISTVSRVCSEASSRSFKAMRATWRPMRPKPLMAMPVACRATADEDRPTDRARAATQLMSRAYTAPCPMQPNDRLASSVPELRPAGLAAARKRGADCEGAAKVLEDSAYHADAAMAAAPPPT